MKIRKPHLGESPTSYADYLGIIYTENVSATHKKQLGQFFTPSEIAKYLGSFAKCGKETIRILDPGCGVGILSTAITECLLTNSPFLKTIELIAFETDSNILPYSEVSFNYLAEWLKIRHVELVFFLCKNDFVLHNQQILNTTQCDFEKYDFIISNPPYFKISKRDVRYTATKSVVNGQTNIYAIFLLISARLLNRHGSLIFLTPKSFASGKYFQRFRELFFDLVDIQNIHIFHSRLEFKRDNVLQETLIMIATAKELLQSNELDIKFALEKTVTISTSSNSSNLNNKIEKVYLWRNLIDIESSQKILHLPTSLEDETVINLFKSWENTIETFGWNVSTGKIVDFRNKEVIVENPEGNTVPLFWLHNIQSMNLVWPNFTLLKGKPKHQFVRSNESSKNKLIVNSNYVLLRRFSSKDDNKKLIAAPLLKKNIPGYRFVGIENHVNYFHKPNGILTEHEVLGLTALFNTKIFDSYFRTFNGNINVSATELKNIKLPSLKVIIIIGKYISLQSKKGINIDQIDLDAIIKEKLKHEC